MDDFHKQNKHGPGGYHCPCCGPSPNERVEDRRLARTKLKRKTKKEIDDQLKDLKEKEDDL